MDTFKIDYIISVTYSLVVYGFAYLCSKIAHAQRSISYFFNVDTTMNEK